jgi:hypothetical protein
MHIDGPVGQFVRAPVLLPRHVPQDDLGGVLQILLRAFPSLGEIRVLDPVLALELAHHELRVAVDLEPGPAIGSDRGQRVEQRLVLGLIVGPLSQVGGAFLDQLAVQAPSLWTMT